MDQFLSEFIDEFAQQFDEGLAVAKEAIEPTTPFRETVKVEADILFTQNLDHWWRSYLNVPIAASQHFTNIFNAFYNTISKTSIQ